MNAFKDGAMMRNTPGKRRIRWMLAFPLMLLSMFISAHAQNAEQQPAVAGQSQTQITQADQMLGPLNLTQEQVQKIRTINAELKDERQTAGQRLRLAQRALTEAIESPTPNEQLIEQRSKEFADAQANAIRLRSLTQARVLQVLTPEQRTKLRMMQQRNQGMGRQRNQTQQPGGNRPLQRILRGRQDRLQRNPNANSPGAPKQRPLQRQPPQQRP
jgi:Spy/CpxP family protein refolding chaperone